jgi:tetratricopeptide (TPR) repeat protein
MSDSPSPSDQKTTIFQLPAPDGNQADESNQSYELTSPAGEPETQKESFSAERRDVTLLMDGSVPPNSGVSETLIMPAAGRLAGDPDETLLQSARPAARSESVKTENPLAGDPMETLPELAIPGGRPKVADTLVMPPENRLEGDPRETLPESPRSAVKPAGEATLVLAPENPLAGNPNETLPEFPNQRKTPDDDQTMIVPPPASAVSGDSSATVIFNGEGEIGPVVNPTALLLPGKIESPTVEFGATPSVPRPADPKRTAEWGRSTESRSGESAGSVAAGNQLAHVSIPGYRILGELGRGGMGVVYRAQQVGINRIVALKMIIAGGHASPDQLLRFQAEAESVGRLQHPNIVQIYDIGKHDGLPYFSLEFVDGKPLDKVLDGQPQPDKKGAELIEKLARAMHYAHENNVIHRDLKPANILLTKTEIPKITDFGLAKQMESDSSQTKTGTIMGTPSYMAPEQGRGEKTIGHLADVYALGSMLYETMTGHPPFLAPTALKTLMRLLNEEPVPPSRVQPGLSRDLETICLKCLQKDPAKRYATALELAEDLRRFQNGEAILARPISRAEKLWRWIKRNPRSAVMGSTVAVLLVAVVASLTMMGINRSRQRAAIAESRKHAEERLEQAGAAISAGESHRALILLGLTDPLLSSAPELADVHDRLIRLRAQSKTFNSYYDLLDRVRYYGLYCTHVTAPRAKDYCHELLELYERIEQREDASRQGWPELDKVREQQLKEDKFEMFLVAAKIEDMASDASTDPDQRSEAARLAISYINRANQVLPGTKAYHVMLASFLKVLNEEGAATAELEKGNLITPTIAVDRFWHAYADMLRGNAALIKQDGRAASASYRQAATGFAKVLEASPGRFWNHVSWANCLSLLGDRYGAVVGFTNAIHLRPDVGWIYANRGLIHLQIGELDLVRADYDRAATLEPDNPTVFYQRGVYFSSVRDLPQAISEFGKALSIQPAYPEPLRDRAFVLLQTKQLDASLDDWKELGKLKPGSYEPHYFAGVINLGRGRFSEALLELDRALEKKSGDIDSLAARATTNRWRGDIEAAQADHKQMLDVVLANQPRGDYLIERADLLRALGKYEAAVDDYQRCVTLLPEQTDGYVGLAQVYELLQKPILARECYDRMIKANKVPLVPYLLRAAYFRKQSDFDAALSDCELAGKIDPKSLLPGLVRAGITAAQGKHEQAVKAAEELLAQSPPNDGRALYAALEIYSLALAALQSDSDHPDAAKARAYADRAVQLLTTIVGPCFHDFQYPEHNRMAWDKTLDAIRELAQVQKLLEGRR